MFPETKTQTRHNEKTASQYLLCINNSKKHSTKYQTQKYIKKDYTPYLSTFYLRNAGLA